MAIVCKAYLQYLPVVTDTDAHAVLGRGQGADAQRSETMRHTLFSVIQPRQSTSCVLSEAYD
jgi:hypothetical protein